MQKKITSILSIFLCIFLSFHCFLNDCISYKTETKSHDCCGSDSDSEHNQKNNDKCDTPCKKVVTLESSKIKITPDNLQSFNFPTLPVINISFLQSYKVSEINLTKISIEEPPNQQLILTRNTIESIAPPKIA